MKNTYLLDQYIALMDSKLSLAKLHKEKKLALYNNQYEQAADLRAKEYEMKTQIENITEDSWNYFTQHLKGTDKQIERPTLYLIIDQSTNSPQIEPSPAHNTQEIPFPSETPMQAFKEHFAHEFNQLTELYEKLQSEEKYKEAKVVLEMSMMVGEWLGR